VTLAHGWLRVGSEVAATVVLYRCLVSPTLRWCALRLGFGEYPAKALNGTYPAGPPTTRDAVRVCLVAVPLTAAAALFGAAAPGSLRLVPATALLMLLWKYLTLDYDAAHELSWQRADRLAALVLGAAAVAYPALSLAALIVFCGRLGAWTHHSMVSVRLVKASFAWSLAAGGYDALAGARAPQAGATGLLIVQCTFYLAPYVLACRDKVVLGARPWSWVTQNRTEMLIACAYAQGWGRWVPARTATGVIGVFARGAVWLNAATLLVEGIGLLAFAHPWLLLFAVVSAAFFNTVVAVTTGLLFWENIVMGTVLALVAATLPDPLRAASFGLVPWSLSAAMTVLFLAGFAVRPLGLGWWDTPFVQRVHWTVMTSAGKRYGLYNDFMSPFEREYGRTLGNPLASEPFVVQDLGGVFDSRPRDRLLGARPEAAELADVKRAYGRPFHANGFREAHSAYLLSLFRRLNAGVRKSPLPHRLSWLKAPGGHLYYWGDLPGYRRSDGGVSTVQIHYQEVYYCATGREWVFLRDDLLFELEV
jgi:hypothetical protein